MTQVEFLERELVRLKIELNNEKYEHAETRQRMFELLKELKHGNK